MRPSSIRISPRAAFAAARTLFLILVAAGASSDAFAAPVTTALTGTVTVAGRPAAGVTVTLRSAVLMEPRTTQTGASGSYWFFDLPAGQFDIMFSRSGLQTLIRRVTVDLARISRADAIVEPSDDEESVTSTATTIVVSETTAVTTHFGDRAIDRFPVSRSAMALSDLAPGALFRTGERILDDVYAPPTLRTGAETLEQITVVRAALPTESRARGFDVVTARTRPGSPSLFLSLRDTVTTGNGTAHLFETASSGSIVPQRLWFFAAGWAGDDRIDPAQDLHGLQLKLEVRPAVRHHATLQYIESDSDAGERHWRGSLAALRYSGQWLDRLTLTSVASRTTTADPFAPAGSALSVKTSYFFASRLGDHVLTAGGRAAEESREVVFVNDRWSFARWTIDIGLRHAGDIQPRAAVAWDVTGDGRHAAFVTWSESDADRREVSAGYATAIGTSGSIRADLIRRTDGRFDPFMLQLEGAYRLFDRFELGGNYTFADVDRTSVDFVQSFNGWFGAEMTFDTHVLGLTLLQRSQDAAVQAHSTDLAIRYALPVSRARLTLAADLLSVFDDPEARLWVRLRM